MLVACVIDKALSIDPDKGPKLLTIARELVSMQSLYLKARFQVYYFFCHRLGARAFKVPCALYLFGSFKP
jgi:hypothetical protein